MRRATRVGAVLLLMLGPSVSNSAKEPPGELGGVTTFRFPSRGEVILPWQVHELTQVGSRIYVVAWRPDGRDASFVASTEVGKNDWKGFELPGRAHLLDGPEPSLCAIREGEARTWNIAIHDLAGAKTRSVTRRYAKMPREYSHFLPYPLGMRDGSLALACSYYYETRHPLLVIPLHLLSGGHGSRPATGWYLDVVETGSPPSKRQVLSFESVEDGEYRRLLVPAFPSPPSDRRPTRELDSESLKIWEFERLVPGARCFLSGGRVICCPKDEKAFDVRSTFEVTAPLPPWMRDGGRPWNGPVEFAETWRAPALDVKTDDDGNFYYAASCWRANHDVELYLSTHSPRTGAWSTRLVARLPPVEGHARESPGYPHAVRLHVSPAGFYFAIWYGEEPLTIVHARRTDSAR